MIPAWFEQGAIMGTFWIGAGSIIAYLARKRLVLAVSTFITGYIAALVADIALHPEQIQPMIQAVMKGVLNSPGGIMPKEAMIKLPFIGKLPASWFEGIVKSQIARLAGSGLKEAAETVGTFG